MNSILMSSSIEGSFCEDSLFTIFFFLHLVQKPLLKPTCIITQKVEWPEQYPSVTHALWTKTSHSLYVPCSHPPWRHAQSMNWVSPSHRSKTKKASKPLRPTLSRMVTVRTQTDGVFLLDLLFLQSVFLELKLPSFLAHFLSFPETFVLQSFWPASSAIHWTASWPRWEGVMSAFGRCAPPCAAASPPPCSLSWTSPTTVTSAGVWVFAASCATVPSATSAFRLQSVWTSLWKSLKCFTTNACCQQITTPRREPMEIIYLLKSSKPTCRDKTLMLPVYG